MAVGQGFTTCACACIQQAINNVYGKNANALRRDKTGCLDYLRSPENLSGIETIKLDPGTGKRKCVTLNWAQKLCQATCNDAITDDCSTGNEAKPFCEDIDITQEFETDGLIFDEDNMRKICAPLGERDDDWIASVINGQFNAAAVCLDKRLLRLVLNGIGTFMDGSTIKAIQLFNTVNSDSIGPRTLAMANIFDEFERAALWGKPQVVGGHTDLNNFFRIINRYGAVNSAGQNVANLQNEVDFWYDRFVTGVFGAKEFIVFAPGVAQFLTWNRMVSGYVKKSPTFEHSTIIDPFTGIEYDYLMHYDDCKQIYHMKLQLNWDYFVIPDEADASCAEHYGVNGVFNYESCDKITECLDVSVS